LIGKATFRLLEAANDAGYHWDKIERFVDTKKCVQDCADCMLGCKRGAKWTSRVYGDEAVANGADLVLNTKVTKVITYGGKAIGVEGSRFGRKVNYYGKSVVLSGGVGDVSILRKTGIEEAGKEFSCDWLQFVGGIIPGMNTSKDQPMSVGTMEHYESDGFVIVPVFPNWSQLGVMLAFKGLSHIPKLANAFKYTGIMVKVRDELKGTIYNNPIIPFSKPVTREDQLKLDKGVGIIKKVLMKAGAPEDSIVALNPSGAHPCCTCRIGEVVDTNLETKIKGLYCCDASVLPSSMGIPVVWTAVALGKRLSNHLAKTVK
jgi:choline dehydrogenase-like flavoprotein